MATAAKSLPSLKLVRSDSGMVEQFNAAVAEVRTGRTYAERYAAGKALRETCPRKARGIAVSGRALNYCEVALTHSAPARLVVQRSG